MSGPPRRPRWRQPDLWALIALALAVSAFHARGLWPGQVFLPIDSLAISLPWRDGPFELGGLQNALIGDPIFQFYPFTQFVVQSLRAGEWPLWHAGLLLGHPLAGDTSTTLFYPAWAALGLAFGAARGLTLGMWLHAVLAAGLTFAWLRVCGQGRPAAMFGALAYALGGYMVTFFTTPFWVSTLAWLPGVLWLYEVALRRRSLRWAAGAGLALGAAALGGQVSFIVCFMGFFAAYAAGRAAGRAGAAGRFDAWPLAGFALAALVGLLVGAAQILPLAEAVGLSHRAGGAPYLPLPWRQAITWLAPNFYGNPTTTGAYWGALNFSEATQYAGTATLLLALLAWWWTRRFWEAYLLALAAGVAYITFGGPGVGLLADLPVLSSFALHRVGFLLPLLAAYLAGAALDSPPRADRSARRSGATVPARLPTVSSAFVMAVAAALTLALAWAVAADWGGARSLHWEAVRAPVIWAALLLAASAGLLLARDRWPAAGMPLSWALVGLLFVDLMVAGSRFNPAQPLASLPAADESIAYLQANAAPHRVAVLQELGEIIYGPNTLMSFGVNDLGGYSSLLPAALPALVRAGDPAGMGYNANVIWLAQPSLRLLDLLQAGHVVSRRPLPDVGLRVESQVGPCDSQTALVAAGQPLSGVVWVRSAAINRLDLNFVVDAGAPAEGEYRVRMWRGADREQLVLETGGALAGLRSREPVTFFFAPEKEAPGLAYAWEVSTDAAVTGARLCAHADGSAAIGLYGADWQTVYEGALTISERLAPLPRAFVVYAAEIINDQDAAIARLLDEDFDLRHAAVVQRAVGLPANPPLPATRAEILEYEHTRVVLRALAQQEGLLLLGDRHYPGWRASINGAPAEVLEVNLVWRGVRLPAGEHTVVFEFRPASVYWGLALSLAGLALALAAAALGGRPREWAKSRTTRT